MKNNEAMWIGSLTIVSWVIIIGFSIMIGFQNDNTVRARSQVQDVYKSLRHLPISQPPNE